MCGRSCVHDRPAARQKSWRITRSIISIKSKMKTKIKKISIDDKNDSVKVTKSKSAKKQPLLGIFRNFF